MCCPQNAKPPVVFRELSKKRGASPFPIISPEPSNQNTVKRLVIRVFDRLRGARMRYRENIPLAIMSVISLAVLFVFGISEMATRAAARHDGCGGSQQAAISPAWSLPSFGLADLSADRASGWSGRAPVSGQATGRHESGMYK
jgi:hypothetical protein